MPTKSGKPNILFLMTDQQRWDTLSCTGGWVNTPNIDRIAGDGVTFTNCVTTSPVCVPARMSLASGLYPHNLGIWQNDLYTLPPETPTWMDAIRRAGYRTSLFGKTHLHPDKLAPGESGSLDYRDFEPLLNEYGLDDVDEVPGPSAARRVLSHLTARWQEKGLWERYIEDINTRNKHVVRPSVLPLEEYADVYIGRKAAAYLRDYDRSEPWFCWVSFGGPHAPWDAPEPYASVYKPESMPGPATLIDDNPDRPEGITCSKQSGRPFTPEEVGKIRANYAGKVALIDDQIGELLRVIEARGELENTVILFTSDHGEMAGDYNRVDKFQLVNGAVRIPLVVRTPQTARRARGSGEGGDQNWRSAEGETKSGWPTEGGTRSHRPDGASLGLISDSLVELIDVGPTLVELAGGHLGHDQFGRSLTPVLSDPSAPHRCDVISEMGGEIMLVNERWKLVINAEAQPYFLFDLERDPNESRNLVGDPAHREVETAMRLRILERLVRARNHQPPVGTWAIGALPSQ